MMSAIDQLFPPNIRPLMVLMLVGIAVFGALQIGLRRHLGDTRTAQGANMVAVAATAITMLWIASDAARLERVTTSIAVRSLAVLFAVFAAARLNGRR
jgi:hypothetical protein